MIFKRIECLFKGHDIDPDESIVKDIMLDKRNWLCKCHRCGMYEMHDGAISHETITLSETEALRLKIEFYREFAELERMAKGTND